MSFVMIHESSNHSGMGEKRTFHMLAMQGGHCTTGAESGPQPVPNAEAPLTMGRTPRL